MTTLVTGSGGATRGGTSKKLGRAWPLHRPQLLELLGGYVVMTTVFSFLGWLLTGPFADSPVVRADGRVERWFAGHRTGGWNAASWWGSQLSETTTKVVVTLVVCAVLLVLLRRWFEALVVAVPLLLEAAVFLTTTLIVGRPRPDVARLDGSPVGSSFPSGHTAAAACYAAVVVVVFMHTRRRWVRRTAVAVTVAVVVAVGVARMYRGMHNPTDVVAGVLLGAVSVVVGIRILRPVTADRSKRPTTGASVSRPLS